ncbi:MAG: hypothetical protein ABIQ35_02660 [Verrucomicrobiota bacterium]
MKARLVSLFNLAILACAAAVMSGCATTESENVSSRPWNTPQGWSGLPSGINEGR